MFSLVQNTLQEQQINTSSPGKLENKVSRASYDSATVHLQILKST